MKYHVIEVNDRSGERHMLGDFEHSGEAIDVARTCLSKTPIEAIESGYTVVVENDKGRRIWGVGSRNHAAGGDHA